jgi:hypothetical protein
MSSYTTVDDCKLFNSSYHLPYRGLPLELREPIYKELLWNPNGVTVDTKYDISSFEETTEEEDLDDDWEPDSFKLGCLEPTESALFLTNKETSAHTRAMFFSSNVFHFRNLKGAKLMDGTIPREYVNMMKDVTVWTPDIKPDQIRGDQTFAGLMRVFDRIDSVDFTYSKPEVVFEEKEKKAKKEGTAFTCYCLWPLHSWLPFAVVKDLLIRGTLGELRWTLKWGENCIPLFSWVVKIIWCAGKVSGDSKFKHASSRQHDSNA